MITKLNTTSPAGKLHIKGDADTPQIVIDANSTQSNTNPLIRLRNSSGTDLIWINSDDTTNIFIGKNTGRVNDISSGFGNRNTFVGSAAGYSNTIGLRNTATGYNTLFANISGVSNSAYGAQALENNNSGSYNSVFGFNSLTNNTTGNFNTVVGSISMFSNINGVENTSIGYTSLYNNTSGDGNTAVGFSALHSNINGHNNVAIGRTADVASGSLTNSVAIGLFTLVDSSNKVRIGNASMLSIGGQVGWSTYSDKRVKNKIIEDVKGLDFIKLLRPVTFHYDIDKQYELLGRVDTTDWPGKHDIEKIAFSGFIAQEVDEAAKKADYNFSGIDHHGTIMGLRYAEFVVPLVKAVQEQQVMIEQLLKQNEELMKRIDKLEQR